MPLHLHPEEARHYLELHQAPAPHLDLLHAMAFRAAAAGLRLGVFEALTGGPLPAAALAARLRVDERGLTVLLEALRGFGYLSAVEGGYADSQTTATWLAGSGGYADVLRFWDALLTELWGGLADSVRDGRPTRDFYGWLQAHPDHASRFQTMLTGLAAGLADEIAATVPLPDPDGPTRLVDVGGGHGRYSVAFCRRHPSLHATIVDVPGALAAGRETVTAEGLADRVTLRPGDVLAGDLGHGYDAALLFNVLHGYDPDRALVALRNLAAALRPGATLALLEPLPDLPEHAGAADAAFVGGFSLNLFHTQGGQVYRFEEYATWLTATGFAPPVRHPLKGSAIDALLVTTRTS